MTADRAAATVRRPIPIPRIAHSIGPASRLKLRRLCIVILGAWVIGAIPILVGWPEPMRAFGLGLFFPGGGFIYTQDWLLAALTVVLVVLAIFVALFAGAVIAFPLLWIGLAVFAAASVDGQLWSPAQWVVPLAAVGLAALAISTRRLRFRRAAARGVQINQRLARVELPCAVDSGDPPVTESTPDDLAVLRLSIDLGLQPLDQWEGFSRIDQFREAALRYQLNHMGYTMAMSQYTRTPAFTGYLAEAQRNAIEKMRRKEVWQYWALENLWGNLRWDPDPIARDNIMYSGYYGVQIGLYELINNDRRYEEAEALSLRWSERRSFPYDFGAIAAALRRNMLGEPMGQIPCEPTWIYPFCNTYGVNTLRLHDVITGGSRADEVIDRVRVSFESGDFMHPDGRIVPFKSKFGFTVVPVATVSEGLMAYWLNPSLPELAERTWCVVRDRAIDTSNGEPRLDIGFWDRIDPGRYTFGNGGFTFASVLLAAREMGDDEVADAMQRTLDERENLVERNGVHQYDSISMFANLTHSLARMGRQNAMRDLINGRIPTSWRTGPILSEVAYPDVLVAKAVTDGDGLELVLRPGNGARRTKIQINRLRPNGRYRATGATVDVFESDARGRALLDIDLHDRHEVRIWPA